VPKWAVLRLALAKSLRIPTQPNEELDKFSSQNSYHLDQVTGRGKLMGEDGQPNDFTDAFCALLSVYHEEDLFQSGDRFQTLLQRHIRRGLREINLSWRENHDFYEYLYQELFSGTEFADNEIQKFEKELLNALMEIGVQAEIRDRKNGPRLTRYRIYLLDINQVDRLRRGLEKLSFSLGLHQQKISMEPTELHKVIAIDIPRPSHLWEKIPGSRLQEWIQSPPNAAELPVWVGVDTLGEAFCFDLAKTPHLFVGGSTNSGKSVCVHAIILSLLWKHSPQEIQICLIDPKEVEFSFYKDLPHLFNGTVIFKIEIVLRTLHSLKEEMEKRASEMAALGFQNFEDAKRAGKLNIPRIIVFIDELADLLMQSKESETFLIQLAHKGRFVGIHLVLSTQRPDAQTFSGLLRSNIPSRIALSVQKSSESKIILDETGAENLSGSGDMLVKIMGSPAVRVHGIHITADDIAACIKHQKR